MKNPNMDAQDEQDKKKRTADYADFADEIKIPIHMRNLLNLHYRGTSRLLDELSRNAKNPSL